MFPELFSSQNILNFTGLGPAPLLKVSLAHPNYWAALTRAGCKLASVTTVFTPSSPQLISNEGS